MSVKTRIHFLNEDVMGAAVDSVYCGAVEALRLRVTEPLTDEQEELLLRGIEDTMAEFCTFDESTKPTPQERLLEAVLGIQTGTQRITN